MEDFDVIIGNLYTAVHMGNLKEVEQITSSLTSSSSWYPNYDLLCVSLLHKHMHIARLFLNTNCEVAGENRRNYRGNSALHSAVLYGDSSLVGLLLKRGASLKSRNVDGLMPIHLVVYRNPAISGSDLPHEKFDQESSKIIDLLLEYDMKINAIVNSQSKYGYTSLHLAAECGNEKIVPILLDKHSNFNARSETGLSPLHVAVMNGNAGIVNLLLNRGAPIYSKDRRGKTPLCWSIEQEQTEMIERLLNFEAPVFCKRAKYIPALEDDYSSLLTAVKMNKPEIVERLLNKGADVNTSWKNGTTPLHLAIENGSEDIIQLLLDHGANVTAVGKYGKTPLYCAVERESTKIVEILLNCVPKINSVLNFPDLDGSTPLQLAIRKGNEEIVNLLLQKGNSVVFSSQGKESPLHTAVLKNRGNVLKLLLKNEVDVDVTDVFGRSALQIAVEQGSPEMVKEFCNVYSKRQEKWKEGYAALCIAARNGRADIVGLLLKGGADLNAKFENYSTPLCAAAENGHTNIVKLFLANGADVNEVQNDGRSALHYAVQRKFYKVVDCLLDSGADVNQKFLGDSPLHFAAAAGNLKILKLLLSTGANVNAKNLSDATPLFIAVERNQNEIVQCLVQNGADVNIEDQDSTIKSFNYTSDCIHDLRSCQGLRPLTVAVDNCNLELVKILLGFGAPADIENEKVSPLHLASSNGSLEIVKELLKFGANINLVCEENYTPFSHAIASGKTETFICLLSTGVNFNINSRNSVLHIALSSVKKDENIVELLLDFGADVRATNGDKKTALHCAISFGNTREQSNLFRLLLDYGSDINAREKWGNTPIHIAAQEGDFEAAEVLLEYEADLNIKNNEGNTALKYLMDKIEDDLILYLYKFNSETCPFATVAKLIVRMIALRESTGRTVNEINLELVKSENINCFFERCKQELSQMKCKKVDKNVSYYDILTKNYTRLASCMANETILQNLNSGNLRKEFPCYATLFAYRTKMGLERRNLIESSEKHLKSILRFKFPVLIVHEIFKYLSSVDLKNMERVFQRPGQSLSKSLN